MKIRAIMIHTNRLCKIFYQNRIDKFCQNRLVISRTKIMFCQNRLVISKTKIMFCQIRLVIWRTIIMSNQNIIVSRKSRIIFNKNIIVIFQNWYVMKSLMNCHFMMIKNNKQMIVNKNRSIYLVWSNYKR